MLAAKPASFPDSSPSMSEPSVTDQFSSSENGEAGVGEDGIDASSEMAESV